MKNKKKKRWVRVLDNILYFLNPFSSSIDSFMDIEEKTQTYVHHKDRFRKTKGKVTRWVRITFIIILLFFLLGIILNN